MRYLKIIVYIIAIVTLITLAISFIGHTPDTGNVVMTVNKHKITKEKIAEDVDKQLGWHDTRAELLNSLAIRQLLIEEAQRQKIDKEPAFRQAIKDFYEQSLINLLLERKYNEFKATVSDEEISQYQQAFGKTYTFLISEHSSSFVPDWKDAKSIIQPFDNLSSTLQPVLASMKPGEFKEVYDTGNQNYWIKVENISGSSDSKQTIPQDMAKKILLAYKQQQRMSLWVGTLLKNAKITINDKEKMQ